MNKKTTLTLSLCVLASLVSAGCATKSLLEKEGYHTSTTTRTVQVPLISDTVVAFAKPASAVAGLSEQSIVIAGQKNSYVLTQGGANFVQVISRLDPTHIKINQKLQFLSAKNDGHFTGKVQLQYVKLKSELSDKELNFFIEQGAQECSEYSDTKMNAQRFCFNFNLAGVVYPAANNIASLKSNLTQFSKPYQVNIYTEKKENHQTASYGTNPLEKLVLLPFAVAIDLVTLPLQAAEKIFD